MKPDVNGMVEADLPEQCALSSDMAGVELVRGLGSMPPKVDGQRRASTSIHGDSTTKYSSGQKRNCAPSDIIMTIKEICASQMKSDLAQEKIRFIEMENTRCQNEDVRRQNEETRCTEEHSQHQQRLNICII
jgi:hypothetical protein